MNGRDRTGERLVALFLLAVLLLSPPLISIVDEPSKVAGLPVLYLYLFAVWALLIIMLALVSEFSGRAHGGSEGDEPDRMKLGAQGRPGRDGPDGI
jgi:hypothetical protein